MFKKLFAILLIVTCVFSSTAFADAKLKATEKNLIVFEGNANGYFFAKIENIGDAPTSMTSSDLVLFSEDDEIILTDGYITTTPSSVVINPGEYLYVREWLYDSKLETTKVADYKFSAKMRDSSSTLSKLDCEVKLDLHGVDSFNNHAYVTFTNTSSQSIDAFYVVIAMHDAENTLLYVDSTSYSSIIVHPNSTLTIELSIDNDCLKYYALHNLIIKSIDAMVCYKK